MFLSKIFDVTVPKNFVGEPFSVSLVPGIKKKLCLRGLCHFFIEFFCLAVPKNFEGEPFCAVFQKVAGSEYVYGKEKGSIKSLRRKLFLSQDRKFHRGNI